MKSKGSKTKTKRNYEKERKELFRNIKIDPKIRKTIELINRMNELPQTQYEIKISHSGTKI